MDWSARSLGFGTSLVVACLCTVALAEGTRDVRQVFFIAKSENKNQVHYGVHLASDCAPAGPAPVFAYWRMLERGTYATEPLLDREGPAYGLAEQRVLSSGPGGGRVRVTLRALPRRPILIESTAGASGCTAVATTTIAGQPASLQSVYVQLRWPFGVDHLLLWGRGADGRLLHEKISP